MVTEATYECKYCKKKFYKERYFMQHECTPMLRSKEIQTIIGQQAYAFYKHWLEQQRMKAPAIETFITSSYYSSFVKFAEWVKQTGISEPLKYIELMLNSTSVKISPALWRRSETYQMYLEHMDNKIEPVQQALTSIETLLAIAELAEINPDQIFNLLKYGEVLELIQQRRLSPWLLFCSKSFKEWVSNLDSAERTALMNSIGIDYWVVKLEKKPLIVKEIKQIAKEIGL